MSVLAGHQCEPSTNPRNAQTCRKCGRPMPASRIRDLDYEREITRDAAKSAIDPQPLIEHAEARASQSHGYGDTKHVRGGIDWVRECRAELADARNYLAWWLEENPEDLRKSDVLISLRFVALAYDRLLEED